MALFPDLPLVLLPPILSYILKPNQLSNACRVNRTFYDAAVSRLYYKVCMFSWHKDVKTRVVQLFATLARCPHLARHVRHLEIRDFAKSLRLSADDRANHVFDDVLLGLKNCVNLQCCVWTRDGSLTSEILQALLCSSANVEPSSGVDGVPLECFCGEMERLENRGLRELEINGHDEGLYDRALLLGFVGLERMSLIMPSAGVVSLLPTWTSLNYNTLRRLTLICKASSVVTDEILVTLSPMLDQLEELHLAGCPKVTHQGVLSVLSSNTRGIVGLRLEGISPRFDMTDFSRRCTAMGAMRHLRSITLTPHQQSQPLEPWLEDVLLLLAPAPLEVFQMYPPDAFIASPVTNKFWQALVTMHGGRLTRFAVHRMVIGWDTVRDVCERCGQLEQLFIVITPATLRSVGAALACGKNLRAIHINYPLDVRAETESNFAETDALTIVNQCSSTLVQLGCNTRVWQVINCVHVDEEGSIATNRALSAYDSPGIPEQFLVVRT
ncbi:hypothetical protein AX15_000276 [Amanita polypyramis BW_CC]|nr:hypothetical protein AX15_000276 [Amanita polypyramis BW_CC]